MNNGYCGHCTARMNVENRLVHDKTCPIGLAYDKVTAEDAEWFVGDRVTKTRIRPITQSEIIELLAALGVQTPENATYYGTVFVNQIRPGIRTRRLYGVYVVIDDTVALLDAAIKELVKR